MAKSQRIGLAVTVLASGLVLTSGSAFAACDETAIGATMGNPEKDTIGFACAGPSSERAGGDVAPSQRSMV